MPTFLTPYRVLEIKRDDSLEDWGFINRQHSPALGDVLEVQASSGDKYQVVVILVDTKQDTIHVRARH
jgi:hypothetical protein